MDLVQRESMENMMMMMRDATIENMHESVTTFYASYVYLQAFNCMYALTVIALPMHKPLWKCLSGKNETNQKIKTNQNGKNFNAKLNCKQHFDFFSCFFFVIVVVCAVHSFAMHSAPSVETFSFVVLKLSHVNWMEEKKKKMLLRNFATDNTRRLLMSVSVCIQVAL